MNPTAFLIVPGLLTTALAEDPISVRLVQYQVGASLSDKVPFEVKPMGHKFGAELAFLVSGPNLVAFKEDSVVIDRMLDRDGNELSKNKRGKSIWEEGSFPKVSEDGDVGSFTVELRGELMGRLEGAKVEGSVVMFTGGETDEATGKLIKGAKPIDVGPFKVSISSGGMFGGKDSTSIKVVGDYASIIELEIMDGGKKLNSSGGSWSGDSKTFSFSKAENSELEVRVSYWKNLSETKVPFQITVGG
ncbi:hypothetical protein [Haloferula sp.]|uniref:hypothetical protein n=1 Tax=Haloferula sp. TaxID=2497595 RepID=UPI003C73351C